MFSVSFGIDGTLVDTHNLIRQAYEIAGVRLSDEVFSHVVGDPWRTWLPAYYDSKSGFERAELAHARQTTAYAHLVCDTPPIHLSPIKMAHRLIGEDIQVRVITSMAMPTAHLIMGICELPLSSIALVDASVDRQIGWIAAQGHNHVHVDSDTRVIELLDENRLNAVHYQSQDYETLWGLLYGTVVNESM